ncbi:outer membrane porin, OprD family [Acinetobacter sp. SwsAc6]|uniref:OprD family outer membrane porin n=1 Tax=Acinetobacter TaxID=469 RepID=UPI000EA33BA8|nr:MULTISPECIES: OprD family outer membrane porin [Acinetobacter]NWK72709.1 outer membrane porin, OprD family [Acinetobacter sp. SwsAc6]RKG45997.1 outer membrane porin, OprD family [Acinetobacter cumulans]RKG47944.1 outer membrane porin, OprD family [Acinetobacter cumulans]RZG61368.1 outer membrane porin, OprD family [Acinetobacter sp. WCHAc060006]
MLKSKQLTLALLVNAFLISSVYASKQSEAKGFVEDAEGTVLFRTGFIDRDKKNGVQDTRSTAESAIFNLESGYTKGIVGFGVGVVGDASVKLGDNKHAGNGMIPRETGLNSKGQLTKGAGDTYDHWARGGANVKARFSNTEVRYGTQVLDLPVLASNTARMVPEYFEGTLIKSREIKNLEVIAGKFTKNQYSDQISTDARHLDSAVVWGAKYKFDDQLNASYYGMDSKNKLDRHYINANYTIPLAEQRSLTLDFNGYHTEWDKQASTYSSTIGNENVDDRSNSIWSLAGTLNQGAHSVMLAYQQNTGNTGYDYGENADGAQSIYVANSYLSDFIGNHEKSAQVQYNLNFADYGIPGLNWTSAYVYGWDIKVAGTTEEGKEQEFFNQVKYTVQSGFAKDASLRLRNSIYRANNAYDGAYIGDTNEWRIFLDIPVKLF